MAIDLLEIALAFLEEYGLIAVFILLFLDGAMLMPVLPGELVMIMAVAQYAETPGDLVGLIALATAAAIAGSLLLYGIMRGGGRKLIEKHPKLFMINPRRRMRLERSFQKPSGQTLVLFLRIIPLTRVLVNIPAGLAKMKLGRFVILSSIGMLIFHAGFMWFAFEYRQPGSAVALQAAQLQEAYANPAWEYVQANQVIAGLGAVLLGAFLSLRSSKGLLQDPEYASASLLGALAVRVLFFGSLVLGAFVWLAPAKLYEYALRGGLDIPVLAERFEVDPVALVSTVALVAWSLGVVLLALEKGAKRRQKRLHANKKRILEEEEEVRAKAAAYRDAETFEPLGEES